MFRIVYCLLIVYLFPEIQEAAEAILRCKSAGIRVMMITGLHTVA